MVSQLPARLRTSLFVCGSVLALCSCATGGDQKPVSVIPDMAAIQAGTNTTQAAQAATQAAAPADWWSIYGDPQLDQLLGAALDEAPSMTLAAARIRRAQAEYGVVAADKALQITGSAKALEEHFPDHYTYPSPYAGEGGSEGGLSLDARYSIDFWGKRREAVAAASQRVEVTRAEAADAKLLLQTEVVQAYIQLDAAYKVRDIAAAAIKLRGDTISLLNIRAKAGLSTDLDAISAREAITDTRSEVARLDGEIGRRRNQIAALIGKDPAFGEKLSRPKLAMIADPAPLSAIPATLLGYRHDVEVQRATVEAAAHEIGVAKASFYPDVDITAFAGLESLDIGFLLRPASAALGIGPAITLPIFDGGRLRSNLQRRDSEYDAAVSAYNNTIATALQQVADAIVTLQSERARALQSDEAVQHWQRVVNLQKIRTQHGLSDSVDLTASQLAMLMSQRHATEAAANIAVAQTTLVRALGGAWSPSSNSPAGRAAPALTISQRP